MSGLGVSITRAYEHADERACTSQAEEENRMQRNKVYSARNKNYIHFILLLMGMVIIGFAVVHACRRWS